MQKGLTQISILPGFFVEANRQGQFWLKHGGVEHDIGLYASWGGQGIKFAATPP